MKRVITACCLLVAIVILAVVTTASDVAAANRLLRHCDVIEEAITRGDGKELAAKAEAFADAFEEEERLLPFFTHHAAIDSIHEEIDLLSLLAKQGDIPRLSISLSRIRSRLYRFIADEYPLPESIF